MSGVPPDQLAAAREMDLLTYLRNYDPGNLVRLTGNTYCTKEHDSLKISNGKWYWFSRGIGGCSALDYLIKVECRSLPEAVRMITGQTGVRPPVFYSDKPEEKERRLILPEISETTSRVKRYLEKRCISPWLIDYCIDHRLLFESKKTGAAIFAGYDDSGQIRYAAMRGTNSGFKGDATGSDKRYSFSICESEKPKELHIFEAAIDLLSYITICEKFDMSWQEDAYLSLAGVFAVKRSGVLPKALERFLNDKSSIRIIHMHLDNDDVGRSASKGIYDALKGKYEVLNEPPAYGKDVNEMLQMQAINRTKEVREDEHKDSSDRSR